MKKYKPPQGVVIVSNGQAGTVWYTTESEVVVLLANGDIWYGPSYETRIPSSREELAACPRDINKWKDRGK
jgi:spermidine/putrescine-binding protein